MAPIRTHADDRHRVLDATDIVQLVGEHVTLRPKGREYIGLCPFHDDHKPSMYVVPHKGIYHCFSCGAGGDAFTFVMNYHRMGFREALEYLARRARVELTPWRPGEGGGHPGADGRSNLDALLSACLTANDFFRTILQHPEHGRIARELIARRGISPDMVQLFGLGAAPDRWDGLIQVVQKKGLPLEPFFAAGLLKRRESSSGAYDAFRNRLIFPITDQIGRIIAFGGRRLSDEKRADGAEDAKYLNSPESAAFNKSATLFGLHQAAPEIRRTRTAIVTEGYMDTIACHQAGITNAIATLGTALTPANAKILRRQCETVVLLFDGDEAGQRAAERAVEVFFSQPIDVKIAMLSAATDAKDPDELLKLEDGLEVFHRVLGAAVDPLTLLMDRIRAELSGRGIAARSRILEEFVSRLVDLGLTRVEPIRKELMIRRLGAVAGVPWEAIVETINKRAATVASRPGPLPSRLSEDEPDARPYDPSRATLAERLVGCILCDPSLVHSLEPEDAEVLEPEGYASAPVRAVVRTVAEFVASGQDPSLPAVLAAAEDPEVQRVATGLASEVDRLAERTISRVHELWNDWIGTARRDRAYRQVLAPAGDSAPAPAAEVDPVVARLQALRELAASVGTNPASIPTPASTPVGPRAAPRSTGVPDRHAG